MFDLKKYIESLPEFDFTLNNLLEKCNLQIWSNKIRDAIAELKE